MYIIYVQFKKRPYMGTTKLKNRIYNINNIIIYYVLLPKYTEHICVSV